MTDASDASDSPAPPNDEATTDGGTEESAGGRDVAVPMHVYKAVTVFSTLFAIVAVVVGFVLLDEATQRATAAPEEVNVALAVAGLLAIAAGAGTYAFSTRFRAAGMGNPKDEAD
jgi:heme A synthase